MRFEEIRDLVKGVPFIDEANACLLYDLIIRERTTRILELGIAHGTGTCYMAAALEELGGGLITAVDLIEAEDYFKPSPEEQLAKASLADYVEIHRMQTGYTWFLHDEIARHTISDVCEPLYDLCIIDGPKNWTIDGCAFFLADKLLKAGGWIIFDDYLWTYAEADSRREQTDGITHRSLSDDERRMPQIREIFELLVKQHPDYSDFDLYPEHGWAIARKRASESKKYTVHYSDTYADEFARILASVRRIGKRLIRV